MRANYQTKIWKLSLQCYPDVPTPAGYGWCPDSEDEGHLAIDWMNGDPAPQALLQLLSCNCSRSCKIPGCPYMVNGLNCTDMCKLHTCSNRAAEEFRDIDVV